MLMVTVSACSMGTRVQKFEPAQQPGGVMIQLRLRDGRGTRVVGGELLAVQDSGLFVRAMTMLLFVPNGSVRQGQTTTRGAGVTFAGRPTGSSRERLRLLSRYPGGMTADLLGRLLAAYGRDSVETVR